MAYSKEEIEKTFDEICLRIEEGESLRSVLRSEGMPSSQTFYIWIDSEESKSKQYARATSKRADAMFEDILDIADDSTNDYIETDIGDGVTVQKLNSEHIQRSRLRVDARKWALSKMNPKKYGDKVDIDHTTKGKEINSVSSMSTEELIKRAKATKELSE
jgi:hypothetical protein